VREEEEEEEGGGGQEIGFMTGAVVGFVVESSGCCGGVVTGSVAATPTLLHRYQHLLPLLLDFGEWQNCTSPLHMH
jgi:hypothetical protein